MTPVIYADILFLYNFFMDSIILFITARAINVRLNILKIAIGGVLGGVYSVFMFFPSVGFLYSLFFKFAVLLGIFYLVFGDDSIHKIIRNFAVFMAINMALGGCMFALIFLTDFGVVVGSVVSGSEIYLDLSPVIIMSGIGITYGIMGCYRRAEIRALYEKSLIKRMTIEYKGKTAEVNMFYDTGCRVYDPVTDKPALLVEMRYLKMFLTPDQEKIISEGTDIAKAYTEGLRVLHISTISGDGTVFGIVADRFSGDGLEAENVTVGLLQGKINENYSGIINPEIFNENICEGELIL